MGAAGLGAQARHRQGLPDFAILLGFSAHHHLWLRGSLAGLCPTLKANPRGTTASAPAPWYGAGHRKSRGMASRRLVVHSCCSSCPCVQQVGLLPSILVPKRGDSWAVVGDWVPAFAGAGRRSSASLCAFSWCRFAEQPLPARRQGPRQRQETGCGAEPAGDAGHLAVTGAVPAAARTGAGPSSRCRWDRRTSAPRPGTTRGGGTVPAPSCSSRFACQLPPCMPLGLAQGSPGACLAMPLSFSPPGWQGWGNLWGMGREGGAQKGPQLVLEGKEGLPHPYRRAAPLHACLRVSPAHWCAPLFSLLVPSISRCGRGGGL